MIRNTLLTIGLLASVGAFAQQQQQTPKKPGPQKTLTEKQQNLKKALTRENLGNILKERDRARVNVMKRGSRGGVLNEAIRNDQVEDLVELPSNQIVQNIKDMDTPTLKSAKLETQPWSDDYWAIYKGVLGARYTDSGFSFGDKWKDYYEYATKKFPVSELLVSSADKLSEVLSPSEKYDLLIGSGESLPMTKYGWKQGKMYFDEYGKVETWMGICHGWAPAAYMMARPQKAVEVMAADGKTKLKFYPSDIKALASLLWANAQSPTRFVGGRCNDKEPKKDENGRITSQGCFDVNPGLWHMMAVNQIGVAKRSMVIDVTYDYEVWNQPVLGYSIEYFNVSKGQDSYSAPAVKTLKEAVVDFESFKDKDKYKKYRNSPAIKSLLGVRFTVNYIVETSPSHNNTDSPRNDAVRSATYSYDLELDEKGDVLGGEWYEQTHPDFVWTPSVDGRALSDADHYVLSDPSWDGTKALPARWRQGAAQVAPSGQPLARIVESLIELSNK